MAGPFATSDGSTEGAHASSHVLESDEEEDVVAPPSKGRGVAIGEEITRLHMQLGHAIPLEWDNTKRTRKAVGKYAKLYYTAVGIYVRTYCEAWHDYFKDVPASNVKKVLAETKHHFRPVYRDVILKDAASRYNNWKYDINKEIKRLGPQAETSEKGKHCKSRKEWLECVKRFRTEAFQKISGKNIKRRQSVRYPSMQGRTSQAQRRHNSTSKSDFEVFKQIHTNKKGEWNNPLAAADYNRMQVEAQRILSSTSAERLTPEQEKEIMVKILGPRRGFIPGIGPSIPSKSLSQRFTTAPSLTHVSKAEHDATRKHLHDVTSVLGTILQWIKTAHPDTEMPDIHIPPPPPVSGSASLEDDIEGEFDDELDDEFDDEL